MGHVHPMLWSPLPDHGDHPPPDLVAAPVTPVVSVAATVRPEAGHGEDDAIQEDDDHPDTRHRDNRDHTDVILMSQGARGAICRGMRHGPLGPVTINLYCLQ